MFALIGDIFTFIFDAVKLVLGLIWGAIELIFGLLGGVFSFILGVIGFILALALIYLAVTRRTAYKQHKQAQAENAQRVYDVDEEEFTSFYDQYRTESQE